MTRLKLLTLTSYLIPLTSILLPAPLQALTVDLNSNLGSITTKGTGFHGGLHDDTPNTLIDPLQPGFIRRPGGSLAWERARRLNITLIELLPGYDYQNNWPAWENHVRSRVNEIKNQNISYHYDVWNEPDHSSFWTGTRQQFFDWWRDTYHLLKEIDPQALVSGPSISYYNSGWINEFLTYARNNQVIPDILSWHEMGITSPAVLESNYNNAQNIMSTLGITINHIHINEALTYGPGIRPGVIVAHLGHSHRYNTLGIARAYWTNVEPNARLQLNHLLTAPTGLQPRSAWWTYQRYATMTGNTLAVHYDSTSDAVASRDDTRQKIFILVGKYASGEGPTITLSPVSSISFIGTSVRIKGQRIAASNANPLPEPTNNLEQTVPVTNNSIVFTLTDMNQNDAYFIEISPNTSSPTPTPVNYSLDSDTDIDIIDILILISRFTQNLLGDFNQNGRIDIFDFNTLLKNRL